MAKLILETEYGMRVIRDDLPESIKIDDILYWKDLVEDTACNMECPKKQENECKQINHATNQDSGSIHSNMLYMALYKNPDASADELSVAWINGYEIVDKNGAEITIDVPALIIGKKRSKTIRVSDLKKEWGYAEDAVVYYSEDLSNCKKWLKEKKANLFLN